MKRQEYNYTAKSITEFTSEDTLYITFDKSGFRYTIFAKFIKFEKGIVTGEILDIQPNDIKGFWLKDKVYHIGDEYSSRITKCYTYMNGTGCKWFKKVGKDWNC